MKFYKIDIQTWVLWWVSKEMKLNARFVDILAHVTVWTVCNVPYNPPNICQGNIMEM